jgi:hypothetical protein
MASGFRPKKALAITFSVGTTPMLPSIGARFYAIATTRAGGPQREGGLDPANAATIVLLAPKPARSQLLRGSVTLCAEPGLRDCAAATHT